VARAEITNDLVWSHSRAKLFRGCKRAYWFTYYGSWGGWSPDVDPRTRALYLEKKLTARPMWVGTVVHRMAEIGVNRARRGQPEDLAAARAWARRTAREDVDGSRSGAWTERPARRVGFREHYYDEPVTDADWDAAIDEVDRQVVALHQQRLFRRLLDVPERIREVEQLQRFRVGDAEVYVALDVLVDDGRGGVVILDWKTGNAHSEEDISAQLGVYGLYATDVLGVAPDRIHARHVNLRLDAETTHPVGAHEIDAARTTIAADVAAMRAQLVDVPRNEASEDDYPKLPEGARECRYCNFRRTCGRSGPTP
jgi:hypothetical protein